MLMLVVSVRWYGRPIGVERERKRGGEVTREKACGKEKEERRRERIRCRRKGGRELEGDGGTREGASERIRSEREVEGQRKGGTERVIEEGIRKCV